MISFNSFKHSNPGPTTRVILIFEFNSFNEFIILGLKHKVSVPPCKISNDLTTLCNLYFFLSIRNSFLITEYFRSSKLFFLLKTQFMIDKNPAKVFQLVLILLFKFLKNYDLGYEPKFFSDVKWVTNEKVKNQLIQNGFESKRIFVTGNPMHDKLFAIPKNMKKIIKNDKKINVLFAPNPMYEHGYTDKQSQFDAVQKIIRAISEHNDKFNLVIKIHPHSSKLFEYKDMLNEIDPKIPIFQKGIATNFLIDSDVLITFTSSSIILNSILLGKPVIIYNFTNFQNDPYLNNKLATECSLNDNLLNKIEESLLKGIDRQELDLFVKNEFYSLDGKSSERVSKVIMDVLESHYSSSNN